MSQWINHNTTPYTGFLAFWKYFMPKVSIHPEAIKNLKVFWYFQGYRNRAVAWNCLRCYQNTKRLLTSLIFWFGCSPCFFAFQQKLIPEVYSEPCQTSVMDLFTKIVNDEKPLTSFIKSPSQMFDWFLNACLQPGYVINFQRWLNPLSYVNPCDLSTIYEIWSNYHLLLSHHHSTTT